MKQKSLYISPKAKNVGSLFVSLGIMEKLSKSYKKVAFFKPIVIKKDDYSISFMKQRYKLKQQKFYGFTLKEATELIYLKKEDELFMTLIKEFYRLLEEVDFVVCEGVPRELVDRDIPYDLNLKISHHFSSPIINVVDTKDNVFNHEYFKTFISRANKKQNIKNSYSLKEIKELDLLSDEDIFEELGVDLLYKHSQNRPIKDIRVLEQSIDEIRDGDLVVLSSIELLKELLLSDKKPAFVLLSSGKSMVLPNRLSFSVASTPLDTFQTIKKLLLIKPKLRVTDKNKIEMALELFNSSVDFDASTLLNIECDILTPVAFEYKLRVLAKKSKKRIILVEKEDERVQRAAKEVEGIVDIIFLDYANKKFLEGVAKELYELRRDKGLSLDGARELLKDANYLATMMVYLGYADGMVSGATFPTAKVIRPSLQIIKTKSDVIIASTLFFMCLEKKVVVFGDCALNQNPNSSELAQIAISCAKTAKLFGIEPKVAMLSYSTKDSGSGADVELVNEALKILKQREPDLMVDGPLQYDVAVDKDIAKAKHIDSLVGGSATVFIFPDLNSGNTTYKAVQNLAHTVAIGPILLGLNRPINDLSRGASVKDIVNTILVTAIQGSLT